jgi:hypothetical protein
MPVSPKVKGIGTIRWGTGGIPKPPGGSDPVPFYQDAAKSQAPFTLASNQYHAIIESAGFKPIKERAKIPNNNGFTITTKDILDGEEITLECVYDSAIVWPAEGDLVELTFFDADPPNGEYSAVRVVEVEVAATRKKEGSITIKCEGYAGVSEDPVLSIAMPEALVGGYCIVTLTLERAAVVTVQIWLGPANTLSIDLGPVEYEAGANQVNVGAATLDYPIFCKAQVSGFDVHETPTKMYAS